MNPSRGCFVAASAPASFFDLPNILWSNPPSPSPTLVPALSYAVTIMNRRRAGKNSARKSASAPGRLRIVAGIWRNRVLDIADVPGLRPTSERIRETLFNWLTPVISESRCLDLFAGTGALGLEALSRGAKSAVFVENSARAAAVLQHGIAKLGAENATLIRTDAFNFVRTYAEEPFDIVFVDPPFASDSVPELCRLLSESRALDRQARVYIEQDRKQPQPELPAGWSLAKNKTAGNVRYALLTT